MAGSTTSDWLPRVLFESFLIVISILVALALDEWRETRENDQTVRQALLNFHSEIGQNRSRIEDATPFNQGLLNVLQMRYQEGDVDSVDEFVNMVESYTPAVLQSTAWETALATGSLAKMDYNLVSALSLTYSLQGRYQAATRTGMDDLMSPQNLSPNQMNLAVFNSVRYLSDTTGMEAELVAVYNEASAVIRSALDFPGEPADREQLSLQ
jgi:hypothetical protein